MTAWSVLWIALAVCRRRGHRGRRAAGRPAPPHGRRTARLRRRPTAPSRRAGRSRLPSSQRGVGTPSPSRRSAAAPVERRPSAEPPAAAELETPSPTAGRLLRLRARLARSQTALGRGLLSVLSRENLDDDAWEEVEEALLTADVGVGADHRDRRAAAHPDEGARHPLAGRAARAARRRTGHRAAARPRPHAARRRRPATGPAVLLVVGRQRHRARPRPAASWRGCWSPTGAPCCSARPTPSAPPPPTSCQTWGSRVGAETVRGPEGGDPASVAFDAVKQGTERTGRHRADRHRRPAAHQGRPDGRARQGQAGGRAAGPGRRDAARARRHHRAERADPGPGVHRGRRRHRHRADQARRHGARAASSSACSANSACRSSWSASARAPTTSPRSIPSSSSTRCSAIRLTHYGERVKALYKPAAAPGFELVDRPEPDGRGRAR